MSIEQPEIPAAVGRGPVRLKSSGFAGFSWGQLGAGAVCAVAMAWGGWLTREVDHLKHHRIVAVGLSGMINDFVMTEARSGNSPEQVQRDTAAFMGLLQTAMRARAANGETILVGEAVVGGSVPDVTAEVRAEVGKLMTASQGGGNGHAR